MVIWHKHCGFKTLAMIKTLIVLDIFMHYSPPLIFIKLTCRIPVMIMYLQLSGKASKKPADQDIHCFQNMMNLSIEHGKGLGKKTYPSDYSLYPCPALS